MIQSPSRKIYENEVHSVSAVIVNHNGGKRVLNCINSLRNQDVSLREIIVVDNASTDGSPAVIKERFPFILLHEFGNNRGLPAARNEGIKLATSKLILLVDDDIYVTKESVGKLIGVFNKTGAAVVCPRILLLPEKNVVHCDGADPHFIGTMALRNGYSRSLGKVSAEFQVRACLGACMLVDRETINMVGCFDGTYFFYFEDLEFSLRINSFGYKIYCVPSAVVFHDRGIGTEGLSYRGQSTYPRKRAYFSIRNRLLTLVIHYRARTLLLLSPVLILYELTTISVCLYRGFFSEWFRAWRWIMINLSSIMERRKTIQDKRILNDEDLLVGGPLPIVPGFVRSRYGGFALNLLSMLTNTYWMVVKKWIG